MSYRRRIVPAMDEAENAARLTGLLAMLALPMVRCDDGLYRRRLVELEISAGRWVAIEGIAIEAHRIIVWSGRNGSRTQFEFRKSEGCPPWRTDRPGLRLLVEDDAQPRSER